MSFNDLRKGRYSEQGQIYFVTMVTKDRKPYFSDLYIARKTIQQLSLLHSEEKLYSYAWVVMPDHIHWLFLLAENQSLSKVINSFKGRTARILNKCLNQKGKFWQSGFYDHALRSEEDIKKVARYIVANPLRAGLVERIEDYPHWNADWM